MRCQFLNTHNDPVSAVCGCNTNVQTGEPCHLFYAITYAFMNTQKEDSDRCIMVGTTVYKQLMHMSSIARENAVIENTTAVNEIVETNRDKDLLKVYHGCCQEYAPTCQRLCVAQLWHISSSTTIVLGSNIRMGSPIC